MNQLSDVFAVVLKITFLLIEIGNFLKENSHSSMMTVEYDKSASYF